METHYMPLTQSQSLLWIGQEMNPTSPMYNMVMTYEIKDEISMAHFTRAFNELIRRNDALRSVFLVKDEIPVQVFLEDQAYTLEIIDFSDTTDPRATYENWKKERIHKHFDVSECLLDSALIKLNATHYIWYINQHHLITDAWSNGILFSTMTQLYKEFKENNTVCYQEKAPSYREYIEQEKEIRNSIKSNTAKEYWSKKVASCPPIPNLYNTSATSLETTSNRVYINLGLERSEKLRALANEKGVRVWTEHLSLYNVFLTTLFIYLYRVSGQEQLTIGSPTHNRTTKQIRETVGFFVEVFPLFASIEEGDTFLTLLKKIQVESNTFLKYAQPGVSTSELNRNFNVLFNYIHATYPDFNGTPVVSEWVHPGHHDPRHHIRLHVHDLQDTGEIQLYFDLNEQVFDSNKQALIPQHFTALLDAFIANKQQSIEKPSIVTLTEFEETIVSLNQKSKQNIDHTTITTLIDEQAYKTPLHTSIVFDQETISYIELQEQSNQLAHYLIEQGIGQGSHVAIWLKRSSAYIISVLAVLKTGATYIPIPHNYPKERVTYFLEDSNATMLIGHNKTQITSFENNTIIGLSYDMLPTVITEEYPISSPLVTVPKESTAFLIYTSGSTGNPKGVKITHEALTNYINWTKQAYISWEQPAIPLFTTTGFDITANAVFLPLICGGTIHVYQEQDTELDLSIIDVIEDDTVDFIKLTPAHLNFLKGKDLSENKIQVMVVTGDEFKTELGNHIFKAFGGNVEIYNEYGPSEATIGCIYHKFNPDLDTAATVPIGHPILNMEAYIFDRFLHPVPQGVIGELYLGGVGLANGYWNRPKLTKEKFIENPFARTTALYSTKDLVRLNDKGIIEFIGRTDFQVKINGHRIELGEIEATINSYTEIDSSAVIVTKNEDGFKSLAAYFLASQSIDLKELQMYLSHKLPRYMVPIHYGQLDNLPLSSNGKVDRKVLAMMDTLAVQNSNEYVAPTNEIELEIEMIWCAVFNLSKIGIHDRFIDLGGESLMAIQITTRINEVFELKIPLNKIFELQTIALIAGYIEETLVTLLNE